MNRRLKQAAVALVVLFAATQLIRPDHVNPPTDTKRTIQSNMRMSGAAAVINRSCRDCHTNATVWPAYAQVAPLSWLMKQAITEGRKTVNFSEWTSYSAEQKKSLLALSCQDMMEGKMPGVYTLVRPETQLTPQDIETVCAAAHLIETEATLR